MGAKLEKSKKLLCKYPYITYWFVLVVLISWPLYFVSSPFNEPESRLTYIDSFRMYGPDWHQRIINIVPLLEFVESHFGFYPENATYMIAMALFYLCIDIITNKIKILKLPFLFFLIVFMVFITIPTILLMLVLRLVDALEALIPSFSAEPFLPDYNVMFLILMILCVGVTLLFGKKYMWKIIKFNKEN